MRFLPYVGTALLAGSLAAPLFGQEKDRRGIYATNDTMCEVSYYPADTETDEAIGCTTRKGEVRILRDGVNGRLRSFSRHLGSEMQIHKRITPSNLYEEFQRARAYMGSYLDENSPEARAEQLAYEEAVRRVVKEENRVPDPEDIRKIFKEFEPRRPR